MTNTYESYDMRLRQTVDAANAEGASPLRVRLENDPCEVAFWIESRDGSEEYHFARLHMVADDRDPFYDPMLGPSWFAYDNCDTGIHFERRTFGMRVMVEWLDDMLVQAREMATRKATPKFAVLMRFAGSSEAYDRKEGLTLDEARARFNAKCAEVKECGYYLDDTRSYGENHAIHIYRDLDGRRSNQEVTLVPR